ncbi:hypothetical protein A3194_19120 [Candidatus Thiodiazotropha endoloripes]|uniref:GNAT family N-acetyltransferase n=1 Tax=Candidatus Thiodiazotropha endoloripes TaxID=1818881 RepID=UPI00083D239D|nr:GNAT family N-acetyltransferase [Candidatus Thiodiazotropha endoloripes]ODB82368.1 hypothetical protein A3194_19120 [Candidatus Thiodiazotropha endoloripes]
MQSVSSQVKFSVCSDSFVGGRLKSAISLWKKNRKTLGFFPEGAFDHYALNNWILYLLGGSKVKGYLLYRIAKDRVAITHLCVDDETRGSGGARILFNALKQAVDDGYCRGVEVRCRSDYEISRMWPKLGFECVGHIGGRAKEGSELTVWFYRFDVHDFFYDMMPKEDDDELTWAVLDSNVIFKLSNPANIDSEESLALLSDSIAPYARFFITPEVFVETERKVDVKEKKKSNEYANKFEKLEIKRSQYDAYRNRLKPLWGRIDKDRDRSDLNHIAYTASAGVPNFITQDQELIDKADVIYDACNVQVRRPVDFITELDQIENIDKYTPISISRTKYQIRCPVNEEVSLISEQFCLPNKGEKRKQLEAKIRSYIANPERYHVFLVAEESNEIVGFLCLKRMAGKVSIVLMRHNANLSSRTVVQNLTWDKIFSINQRNIALISYEDENAAFLNNELFKSPGFIRSEKGWFRIAVDCVLCLPEFKKRISDYLDYISDIDNCSKKEVKQIISTGYENTCKYEEVFWPLKIESEGIPTYLIPIKPVWALHLFDKKLAEQELWGADPSKHFNIENVYYRSAKSFKAVPGARILWYVSSGRNKKVSEIRACSRLIEAKIDTAKKLFKEYKRLGIYEWKNLMDITGNDPDGDVMAIRFYQTENFIVPIQLNEFDRYGINGQPFGPKIVSDDTFLKVYRDGIKLDEE